VPLAELKSEVASESPLGGKGRRTGEDERTERGTDGNA
jgi:hypothetical protein